MGSPTREVTSPRLAEESVGQGRDVVVVGASAGGIQALLAMVQGLPADFPAAVFVVVHTTPHTPSVLPRLLERAGQLPAGHARHGEAIVGGRIYVAPPDQHVLVRQGYVELSHGPRENHSRPAVDPLFRSASRAYGSRVTAVVLSGALGDGTAGLMSVKSRGGAAIVQDPNEAIVDGMPRSALRLVEADWVLPAAEIAPVLVQLASEPITTRGGPAMSADGERASQTISEDIAEQGRDERRNELTLFTCPDCGGSLWQVDEGPLQRFRCHVGHAFGPEALLSLKSEELEAALWTCVRLLTEKATLTRQLATHTVTTGNGSRARRIDEQAQLDERHAAVVRELLEAMPNPIAQAAVVTAALEESNGNVYSP
ncbi:MAG: two-component system, chemotaxis family, protein-glutamate methylesterase/glutaminase [Thermomicrobiales bacterium]|nr:two-component system, chemotaxis family, protein-glutamate methylesterase/glutaminase [Thermomicrobiales bacterium]